MTDQARTSRVLIALIVSMTIGAVVLMALDNGALKGGAFSLYRLNGLPGEDFVMKDLDEGVEIADWGRVEILYSNTTSGSALDLPVLARLSLSGDRHLDAHFIICNGQGGGLGQIQPTVRWKQQKPVLSADVGTIRICVVANGIVDGAKVGPSDNQVLSTDHLVEFLQKQFDISDSGTNISRPAGWQL
jgi:hypothetical protein